MANKSLSQEAAKFYLEDDYNCAESVILGADAFYGLGLDHETLRIAAGFGGGMCVGGVCGAVSGAMMALGYLFVAERAHEGELMKEVGSTYMERFEALYGTIGCTLLKEQHHDESLRCLKVVEYAAALLESVVEQFSDRRVVSATV